MVHFIIMSTSHRYYRRRREAEKNRYPLSSSRSWQTRRSVFAPDSVRVDRTTFEKFLPTAIANGWVAPLPPGPVPENQYISLTVFEEIPDITPNNLAAGVVFGFGNVPVPQGFGIVRLLAVSIDVISSVAGALQAKTVHFSILIANQAVFQYNTQTYGSPLNATVLAFVATVVGDAMNMGGFHYLYDDTSDAQTVRSGLSALDNNVPWTAWSLGVQVLEATGNVGIRVGYTCEFRAAAP